MFHQKHWLLFCINLGILFRRNKVNHRDITSNNIVLDGNLNARLIDFGLAYEIKEGTSYSKTSMLPNQTAGYTGDDYKDFGIGKVFSWFFHFASF